MPCIYKTHLPWRVDGFIPKPFSSRDPRRLELCAFSLSPTPLIFNYFIFKCIEICDSLLCCMDFKLHEMQ